MNETLESEEVTIIYKDEEITIKKFEPDNNRFGKMRITDGGEHPEGIWVAFDEASWEVYKNNGSEGEALIGILMNHSLNGIPWGAYVPMTTQGHNRPELELDDISPDSELVIFKGEEYGGSN